MEPSTYQYRVLVKYGKLVNKYVAMTQVYSNVHWCSETKLLSKYYRKFKQN